MTTTPLVSHSIARLIVVFSLLAGLCWAQENVSLRGLVVTADGTVWASGSEATILRSVPGTAVPELCSKPPASTGLDFRGIYAWDARHAVTMSAGTGFSSRLFETTDACLTWHLLFTNPDAQGFWDTIAFQPNEPSHGVILGDAVDGRFTILRTKDGGRHWTRDPSPGLTSNPAGEGAFAASNSSLVILNKQGDLLFGTGGLAGPRIFRFHAQSNSWSSVALPVATKTETGGIFSLACRNESECLATGGNYKSPEKREDTAYITNDGGRTWHPTKEMPGGYRSAVTWTRSCWIVAGPTGADISRDGGLHWSSLDHRHWNALSGIWAAGPKGQLAPLLADSTSPARLNR